MEELGCTIILQYVSVLVEACRIVAACIALLKVSGIMCVYILSSRITVKHQGMNVTGPVILKSPLTHIHVCVYYVCTYCTLYVAHSSDFYAAIEVFMFAE